RKEPDHGLERELDVRAPGSQAPPVSCREGERCAGSPGETSRGEGGACLPACLPACRGPKTSGTGGHRGGSSCALGPRRCVFPGAQWTPGDQVICRKGTLGGRGGSLCFLEQGRCQLSSSCTQDRGSWRHAETCWVNPPPPAIHSLCEGNVKCNVPQKRVPGAASPLTWSKGRDVLKCGKVSQRSSISIETRDLTWRRSIPVLSAGNVFHVSPIFIYTSDNTRGSSHTLVQSAEMFSQISLDFTYIRDLTQVKSHMSVLSAGNTFQ
ncbi:unnamed protein product, partial [Staurois parvus]